METFNILSIDFDFFQKADVEALKCYPDGVDLPSAVSSIVWSSHYANPKQSSKILSVEIDRERLDEMKQILSDCRPDIPVLITNSHVEIYNFICENAAKMKTSNVDLINVDMHHDMFNNDYKMNCGNWVKFVSEDFNTHTVWIANPISRIAYGLNDKAFDGVHTDFSQIDPTRTDAVFLCRSDNWTPPHLDQYFDELMKHMCDHFANVYGEKDIKQPREVAPMIQQIKEMQKRAVHSGE